MKRFSDFVICLLSIRFLGRVIRLLFKTIEVTLRELSFKMMSSEEHGVEKPDEGPSLSYATSWVANGLSWAPREDILFRLAVSSYIQDYKNYVDVIEQDDTGKMVCRATWEHCYPPTKTMFPPKKMRNDFIITTADYLRLWEITDAPQSVSRTGNLPASSKWDSISSKVSLKRVFDGSKANDFCSPVTSCDWNSEDLNMVGCCSIDTTVTIWDLERNEQKTKLVAHDKDVYDIAFTSAHTFASCGAEGSVRFFDLRNMDHCTILYETPDLSPLLRVALNQQDPHYISVLGMESSDVVVIDIRYPSVPASLLSSRHKQPINGMAWSPAFAQNICTVGEDGIVCIWAANADVAESLLEYTSGVPINDVAWRQTSLTRKVEDWIAITTNKGVEILRL